MKRANFKILFAIIFVFSLVENLKSQDTLSTIKSSSRLLLENQWLQTNNIAGTAFSPFLSDGNFILRFESKEGDLNYAQTSPKEQIYSFNSQKSAQINKLVFNGNIGYQNMQQDDVGWTARMNPITHNPYMLADSMFGLYIKDYINIGGGLSYQINNRFSTGIQVNYQVADGARIKDPRPQNKLYRLEAYPSFIYSLNKFKLGINLFLLTGREKINYETLKEKTTYRFFQTRGLGKTAVPPNESSYTRNYYLSGSGAEFQIQYFTGNIKLLSGLGYRSWLEESEDGSYIPDKRNTGNFEEKNYNFFTILNYKKKLIHSFSLNVDLLTGEGIEFIQEAYSLDSKTHYRTIAEISNYSTLQMTPAIKYILAKPYNIYSNSWEVTFNVKMDLFTAEYLLEAEESYTNIISNLDFKKSFYFKNNYLSVLLSGALSYNLDNNLEQLTEYTASQEVAVWNNIIEPDFLLTTSSIYTISTNLRYGRNAQILKNKKNLIYIDFGIDYSSASNDQWTKNKTFEQYTLTLGFTY